MATSDSRGDPGFEARVAELENVLSIVLTKLGIGRHDRAVHSREVARDTDISRNALVLARGPRIARYVSRLLEGATNITLGLNADSSPTLPLSLDASTDVVHCPDRWASRDRTRQDLLWTQVIDALTDSTS